jgi:hypothetical protein
MLRKKLEEKVKKAQNVISRVKKYKVYFQDFSVEIKPEINKHVEKISNVASNRFLKKINSTAFYRQTSLTEAYQKYQNSERAISFSTFYNALIKKYKKPHRLTDLCQYCEIFKEVN